MKRTTFRKVTSQRTTQNKEYTSFNDFLKDVYPSYFQDKIIKKSSDPFEFGVEMAKASSNKLSKLLSGSSS